MSTDSKIIFTQNIYTELKNILIQYNTQRIFILVNQHTKQHCLPLIKNALPEKTSVICIEHGEKNKSLQTVEFIWQFLSTNNADRKSVFINLGGGIICDIGGFAASTFKRGIRFINIPTTLLSQVDASVGGKTGFNFNNLKNEIGAFSLPEYVLIDSVFLKTLDKQNFMSGFGEMIKHALIFDMDHFDKLKEFDLKEINFTQLLPLIEKSVMIKKHFTDQDPNEQGIRKALNFGHTIGHALESFAIKNDLNFMHGEAIAAGMICELFLSNKKNGLPLKTMLYYVEFLVQNFRKLPFNHNDYNIIMEYMGHDKKNTANKINFVLIKDAGKISLNINFEPNEIIESLDFYRQVYG